MKKWENFENTSFKYLEKMLKNYDVSIKKFGNADSTIPDIEITLNKNSKRFFIEIKMPSSQTSQFVVEIINNEFVYGNKNKFETNEFSEDIIKILNQNFEYFKGVSQSGIIVPVPDSIAFGWIASNMKNKNVEFIISVDDKNNKKIIPIERFNEFFNIKTIFRRKKSGSTKISQKYYDDFKNILSKKFDNYELFIESSRLYIKLNRSLKKNECYIESEMLNSKKYFLSKKDNGIYEVKLTSSTNNPNIIFELTLKNKVDDEKFTIQTLIDFIEENEK